MKKLFIPAFVLFFISLISSCVVMSPKKLNTLLAQKDSLSLGWEAARIKINSLEGEIVSLRSDTAILQAKITELGAKISNLEKKLKG